MGDFDLAIKSYKKAIFLNPKDTITHLALAELYKVMGNKEDSEK
jgi:Tfp pilus assembly protein PilF